MENRNVKYIVDNSAQTTAKIIAFTPRPRPEPKKPTLLDVLERQLFDDANP